MQELLVSPRLIDLILAAVLLEAVVLLLWHKSHGGALAPLGICLMMLPGVFLMLALRACLAGTAWPWLPVTLAAALAAHLLDVRQRLRR